MELDDYFIQKFKSLGFEKAKNVISGLCDVSKESPILFSHDQLLELRQLFLSHPENVEQEEHALLSEFLGSPISIGDF